MVKRSPIVRASLANAGHRDELAAGDGSRGGNGLKRFPVVVDEPDAARNDFGLVVLALFDLRADLPLVIRAEQPALVVTERRLGGRPNERQAADLWRIAARDARHAVHPIRCRGIAATRVVVPQIHEASDSYIPDRVGRQRMCQMAEGHGRHGCALARGRGEWRHHCRRSEG